MKLFIIEGSGKVREALHFLEGTNLAAALPSIVIALASIYLLLRVAIFEGLSSIITDEAQYKDFIFGLQDPYLLNPLFVSLFRATTALGNSWYLGVRLLNVFIIIIGLIGLQALCRMLGLHWLKQTAVITAGVCCGVSTYALNIMPEIMVSTAIWWCVVLLISANPEVQKWEPMLLGIALGLSALIKPHAIVLLPAFMAALILQQPGDTGPSKETRQPIIIRPLYALVVFGFIRWGLGYLLAGPVAFGLFGGRYEELGSASISSALLITPWVVARHSAALLLLMPGLGLAAWFTVSQFRSHSKSLSKNDTANAKPVRWMRHGTFLIVALATSIIVYSLFTAKVATNFNQQAYRIHFRYYSYLFPLVLAWLMICEYPKLPIRFWRAWVVGTGSLLLATFIFIPRFAPQASWVEAPVLAIVKSTWSSTLLIGLGIFLLLVRARPFCLAAYTIILFLIGEVLQFSDAYRAMAATRPLRLASEELSRISSGSRFGAPYAILVGEKHTGLGGVSRRQAMQRCMGISFWNLKQPYTNICLKASRDQASTLATFSRDSLDPLMRQFCWAGNLPLEGHPLNTLYVWQKIMPLQISSAQPGVADSMHWNKIETSGLNPVEPWGVWTSSPITNIRPPWPLPGQATLTIAARSLEPGAKLVISLGGSTRSIILKPDWASYTMRFRNGPCSRGLRLDYHGKMQNEQARLIGFAIQSLEIR